MSPSKATRRALLGSLSAATLSAAATFPAHARDVLIVVEPARATADLDGGMSQEDEQYMRKIARHRPLRVILSERKDNAFAAGVRLLSTDTRGTPYVQLGSGGPMTYAMQPAGKYRVTARFKGQSETREVVLDGRAGRDVYLHRKGAVKKDAYDGKPLGGRQVQG